jgi:hypothetical protein
MNNCVFLLVKAFRQQQIAALKALNRENERKRLDIKHSKALEELLSSHKASLEAVLYYILVIYII